MYELTFVFCTEINEKFCFMGTRIEPQNRAGMTSFVNSSCSEYIMPLPSKHFFLCIATKDGGIFWGLILHHPYEK